MIHANMEKHQKISDAQAILKVLGLPKAQQNERSALTLLALLDLHPHYGWAKASSPLRGIRQILDFIRTIYGRDIAENTRETYRRQTIHQFVAAGILLHNPDDPARAVNSSKNAYQVAPAVLGLLRTFGSPTWDHQLHDYLAGAATLQVRYAQERDMRRIPLKLADGAVFALTPGGQNVLIEQVINEFSERFTPGGVVLYVGDTGSKFGHVRHEAMQALGIKVEEHGKMPDVVIYYTEKNWLVLVEAVTSHGPVDPKRRDELRALFRNSSAPLVLVTAFMTRNVMMRYLDAIAWETEVWVAESPSHMIHFNGERFLGPYGE